MCCCWEMAGPFITCHLTFSLFHPLTPGQAVTPEDRTGLPSVSCESGCRCCFKTVVVESLSRVPLFCSCMDCSPPGSSVCGTLQARILEWAAISFSTHRLNPHLLCWQAASSPPSHEGRPQFNVLY